MGISYQYNASFGTIGALFIGGIVGGFIGYAVAKGTSPSSSSVNLSSFRGSRTTAARMQNLSRNKQRAIENILAQAY